MKALTCPECGKTTDMPFHTCNRTLKHTPGTWTINAYGYYESSGSATGRQHIAISKHDSPAVLGYLISAPNSTIAEIKGTNSRLPDAQLIASAPELLETLEEIRSQSWWSEFDNVPPDVLVRRLASIRHITLDAIAKAKGGV